MSTTPSMREVFIEPLVNENPITLQILGLCSALAVTKTLATALIMSAAVTIVITLSNALDQPHPQSYPAPRPA